jgi:hypothetical protein
MFAIYSAAVMSLTDRECKQRLSEPRELLLSRYISATEAALSRAKFMGTTSLIVLQALIIHILSVRDIYEPRAIWTLTGVAIRIAQVMGLERDGSSLGLPPFETEIRRRIWWQLKLHDFRAAELCGLAKFRDLDLGAESTKWPTNVNDDQLYQGMPSLVGESSKITDVIFVAFRCELANFAAGRVATLRRQGTDSSHWNLDSPDGNQGGQENSVKELEEILETKYLRYCDPSQPLHLVTMLVARYAMNVVNFLTHHPRKWRSIEQTTSTERQRVWELSIKLIEQHNMLKSNPFLKQFAWHAPYFRQWHAFIHVLDTLRVDPAKPDAEKAWQLIGTTYENSPDMIMDMKKPIHVAVGNLCLKAYDDHEAVLRVRQKYLPPMPQFIVQLRQQREVAKAKRQARHAKSSRSAGSIETDQENTRIIRPSLNSCVTYVNVTLDSTHLQQSTTSHLSNLAQTEGSDENDPFSFINEFDDSHVGNLDFMLAQGYSMEDNAAETISWEQWDAWLVDSNVMRPLS